MIDWLSIDNDEFTQKLEYELSLLRFETVRELDFINPVKLK
jgi:hypothetical protein